MFIFALLAAFLALFLALKNLPNMVAPNRATYAAIIRDELSPIAGILAVCCAAIAAIHSAVVLFIESASTRLETVIALEEWLDRLNEASGILTLRVEVVLAVFGALFFLALIRITDRIAALKGRGARPMIWLADRLALYRKSVMQIQTGLLLLANVTFLGVSGGVLSDVTSAQIAKAERGIAEVHEIIEEFSVVTAVEEAITDALDTDALHEESDFDDVPPLLSSARRIAESIPEEYRRGFEQVSARRAALTNRVDNATSVASRARRAAAERRAIGTKPIQNTSPVADDPIDLRGAEWPYAALSIDDINVARRTAATMHGTTHVTDTSATAELYRATIDVAAEAVIKPERLAVLEALVAEMPLMQPLLEALVGLTRGLAVQAGWKSLRVPLDVMQGNSVPIEGWIKTRARTIRLGVPSSFRAAVKRQSTEIANLLREATQIRANAEQRKSPSGKFINPDRAFATSDELRPI